MQGVNSQTWPKSVVLLARRCLVAVVCPQHVPSSNLLRTKEAYNESVFQRPDSQRRSDAFGDIQGQTVLRFRGMGAEGWLWFLILTGT
jgi:hypothetical protein